MKQIAGRAGRFGSVYEKGEVVCMAKRDLPLLQDCLVTADDVITAAGLFPSLEQLQWLGIFTDLNVTTTELHNFWKHLMRKQWDIRESSMDQKYWMEHTPAQLIGALTRHFDSISKLTLALLTYIADTRNDTLSKAAIDLYSTGHFPRTPMSKLLSTFKRHAELETPSSVSNSESNESRQANENIYFICDLEEKKHLAATIDDLELSFHDRYMFCMAPVNDDPELHRFFRKLAKDFAKDQSVSLSLTVERDAVPRDPESLLRLEEIHQKLDLYIWLAQRFDSFVDKKKAQDECMACCLLVDKGLRALRPSTKSMRKKSSQRSSSVRIREVEERNSKSESDNDLSKIRTDSLERVRVGWGKRKIRTQATVGWVRQTDKK